MRKKIVLTIAGITGAATNGTVSALVIYGVFSEANIPTGLILALASSILFLGIRDIYHQLPRGYAHLFVGGLFSLFVGGYEFLRSVSKWFGAWLEEGEALFSWDLLFLIIITIGVVSLVLGKYALKNPVERGPMHG